MVNLPWASVVIPTYGEKGVTLTETCLKSLIRTHSHVTPEVFVVSDGDTEPVLEQLERVCQENKASLIANGRGGFAHACNAGLALANGHFTVFLVNNDIEFTEPTLQILSDAMAQTSSGLIGCRLLYPDGTIQHAGVFYIPNPPGSAIPGYFDHMLRFENAFHPGAVAMRNSLVTGALMGISRWFIEEVGFLDERFGFAVEDIDACLNCFESGRQCLYLGYTSAIHHEGASRGRTLEEKQALFPEIAEKENEALKELHRKWDGIDWKRFMLKGN